MKIVSVDVMQVPSGNAGSSRGAWSPVVVRVNTDEGISGFGEVGLAYGKGWRAGFGMVQDFAEQIIGMDPMNNEQIWETIFRKTFWGMGGGTVVNAGISGIDIALWDIKGKALGVPIHTLLGGKMNDNLRTYASQLQYNWGTNLTKQRLVEPEEYAEVTRVAMAEGYDAIKVDPIVIPGEEGKPWKITGPLENRVIRTVYNRVAAMREVGGEDLDIIIEMHSNTDTTAAIQIGHALEDLRIFYYEEPCHPLNVQNMVEVRNAVNIPIATGERLYTRWDFKRLLRTGGVDIIQPDLSHAGGLTEVKKIAAMAEACDVALAPHCPLGPIALASCLNVDATCYNAAIQEQSIGIHYNVGKSVLDYVKNQADFAFVDGMVRMPQIPGLGVEVNRELVVEESKTPHSWKNPVWRHKDGSVAEW